MAKIIIDRHVFEKEMPENVKNSDCDCDRKEWLYMMFKKQLNEALKDYSKIRFPSRVEVSFS